MVTEYSGWILDVYADMGKGAVIWFVCEDGRRLRFTQELAITFYVGGDSNELRRFSEYLTKSRLQHEFTKRKHLFHGLIDVIAIPVHNGALQRALFRKLHGLFPELDYYNADVALPMHYFVVTNTFPLAYSKMWVDEQNRIRAIAVRDDRWGLKPKLPEQFLRSMDVEPTSSPQKSLPATIRLTFGNQSEMIRTEDPVQLLKRFGELVELNDPDIIRTRYGDAWMFPYLFSIAKKTGISFNPNRDKSRQPLRIEANQFESYGRLVHRDQQTLLFGRLHLDPQNSMAFKDWGLLGTYETARLSNLPIQNAARRSAGGSFVGMQVTASLEKGILIPIRKEQRERFKNANQMIAADNGGVIFKPITGLFTNVVEIDFFSMYPHIMTGWNISAETVGEVGNRTRIAPGIGVPINLDNPGIVAEVLKPILKKRAEAKYLLENKKTEGYNKDYLQTAYEFLKGLGWVSYGYQGFSGNRIGSIEAHEAINAVSRNVILQAKEAAEDIGFEVLHIYVDSLFAHLDGHTQIQIDDLLAEIKTRTKLTADHEGTFRWIAFLPSKQNELVPVPNCFFGVFESGEPKCRGIMARRGDTPLYIADVQMLAIGMMAKERNLPGLRKLIPPLVEFFKTHFRKISSGEVALDQLVISQTLSRDIEDFKVITPANAAARQLEEHGKVIRAGQNVEFLRVRNRPRSLSWHLVREDQKPDLDTEWYCGQLLRAADELLSSFGIPREMLRDWLTDKGVYWLPQDFINQSPTLLPLLANTCQSRRLEFINC